MRATYDVGFSALQRAENSSKIPSRYDLEDKRHVSVLFSEPKIPQTIRHRRRSQSWGVSVLFSEPKIPQIGRVCSKRVLTQRVSVLFSEPKIPQN